MADLYMWTAKRKEVGRTIEEFQCKYTHTHNVASVGYNSACPLFMYLRDVIRSEIGNV